MSVLYSDRQKIGKILSGDENTYLNRYIETLQFFGFLSKVSIMKGLKHCRPAQFRIIKYNDFIMLINDCVIKLMVVSWPLSP